MITSYLSQQPKNLRHNYKFLKIKLSIFKLQISRHIFNPVYTDLTTNFSGARTMQYLNKKAGMQSEKKKEIAG